MAHHHCIDYGVGNTAITLSRHDNGPVVAQVRVLASGDYNVCTTVDTAVLSPGELNKLATILAKLYDAALLKLGFEL